MNQNKEKDSSFFLTRTNVKGHPRIKCIKLHELEISTTNDEGGPYGYLKKIEKYREDEQRLKWEGTFVEYLEIVKEKPWVAQSAHSRVYNMIKDAGIEEVDGKRTYKFLITNYMD